MTGINSSPVSGLKWRMVSGRGYPACGDAKIWVLLILQHCQLQHVTSKVATVVSTSIRQREEREKAIHGVSEAKPASDARPSRLAFSHMTLFTYKRGCWRTVASCPKIRGSRLDEELAGLSLLSESCINTFSWITAYFGKFIFGSVRAAFIVSS